MSALKFGDPASIAEKERARINVAHAECKNEFTDREVEVLIDWLNELGDYQERTYSETRNMIRGWLNRHFENKEKP